MRDILAKTKIYIAVMLGLLVITVWGLALGSMPVSRDGSPVRIAIDRGESAGSIAGLLAKKGIIRSGLVFSITARATGVSGKLKPGVYEFKQTMNLPQVLRVLVRGESLEDWVTIPEGYNIRQIGDLLREKRLVDDDDFVRVAISQADQFPKYDFVYGHDLEGYLFPDTYLITRGTDTSEIIEKILDAFEQKVVSHNEIEIEKVIKGRFGPGEGANEGLHKILTIASLVEREAKVPADRPRIAAVLWNRLKKKMKLDIDATVNYKPGISRANKNKVYYTDLKSDSPYNTYKRDGLPPGPICNPGLASIKATLQPAASDDLYYVAKPDGSHIFSRTLAEHEKAKNAARSAKH